MRKEKFYERWQGVRLDDDGAYMSPEASQFGREFIRTLKDELKPYNVVVTGKVGHYDLHGFCERNGDYVYFSYTMARGGEQTDLDATGSYRSCLYRRAESDKDFHGRRNHYCNFMELPENILTMFV